MLRLIQPEDAPRLWELVDRNRSYLRRWLPWLDITTSCEDSQQFIADALSAFEVGESMVNVILDQDEPPHSQVVGICGFNWLNSTLRSGYVGYWLDEAHQGKGLMRRSCQVLERIGFEQMNLNKIEIHVAEKNLPSRRIAEGLGYNETGRIWDAEWLYDHFVDHVIYCKRRPSYS